MKKLNFRVLGCVGIVYVASGIVLCPLPGDHFRFLYDASLGCLGLCHRWTVFRTRKPRQTLEYVSLAGDQIRAEGTFPPRRDTPMASDRLLRRSSLARFLVSTPGLLPNSLVPYECRRDSSLTQVQLYRMSGPLAGAGRERKLLGTYACSDYLD